MEIIRKRLADQPGGEVVRLFADRRTLQKRRWRGVAEDQRVFGFDLDEPLPDGAAFFEDGCRHYVVSQTPEPVLEVRLTDGDAEKTALLGWMFGNLHFPVEIVAGHLRTADDPAVRQMLKRERIAFSTEERVFRPLSVAAHHHHNHHHEH